MKTAFQASDHATVLEWCRRRDLGDDVFAQIIDAPQKKPEPLTRKEYKMERSQDLYDMIKEGKGLKHLYKIKGPVPYINNDPMLSLNVAFYQDQLNKKGVAIKLWQYAGEQSKLKELSQWAQKSGPKLKDWHLLVGVENLYGWRPNDDDISQDVLDWVSTKFKPNWRGSEELFYDKFRAKVRQVLRWKGSTLEQTTTLREFCTNIVSTGTPGSAFDPGGIRLKAEYDGIPVKPYNNKFSKSAALSVENKLERITSMEKQKCKVSVKMEFFPKKRLIVGSDYNTTLKMRFVDTWIQNWMKGNPMSTLWMTKEQMLDMWIRFSKDTEHWNSPVDQSAFDHRVSIIMVKIVLEEVKSLIGDHATNNSELLIVMDSIIFALDGGSVIWKDSEGNDRSVQYENGVLSGWQWTSFINSIVNISEHLMALDMMTDDGIPFEEGMFNATGDDQLEQFKTARACLAYWASLTSMGFVLHPFKNFFSKKHNEYLRKISTGGRVTGYPARMVNSLLWLYPGTNQPKDKIERMRNIVSNWEKFGQRMGQTFETMLPIIANDIRGAKIEIKELEIFLTTSKVFGGYGYLTGTDYELDTEGGKWKHVKIEGRGYEQFKLRFGLDQNRELDEWIYSATAIPDIVKDVELKTETQSQFKKRDKITPLQCAIITGVPKMTVRRSEEPMNTLFSLIPEVMERYFPDINTASEYMHAPRKWIAEYLSGKLKIPAPRMEGLSEEYAGLLWSRYTESICYAMYTKQTRSAEKWNRLCLYAETHFSEILSTLKLPVMVG